MGCERGRDHTRTSGDMGCERGGDHTHTSDDIWDVRWVGTILVTYGM